MFDILDTSSKRLINTLEFLLKSENWLTIRQLSDLLNVSEKTINDDLTYIQDNLNHKVELEFLAPYGFRAPNLSVNIFLDLQSQILLNSIPIQFILALVQFPDQTLHDYAEKLHTSRSTLYRYLPIISDYFKKYQLEIKKNGSFYSFVSKDEYHFRRFFSTFLFEIHGYNANSIVSEHWQVYFKNRLKYMYTENGEDISDLQISYYSIYYQISIQREQQGRHISYEKTFTGKNVPFTEEEKQFLIIYQPNLSTDCLMKIESSIYIHRHTLFSLTDSVFITEVSLFLNKLYDLFQIKGMEHEKARLLDFMVDLCINIKYFQIPYHFFYDRFDSFSKQVEITNTAAHNLILNLIKELGHTTCLDFSLYFDHLIYLFIVSLPQIIQAQFNQPILIVSSYSTDHGYFLLKMIQGQLNMEDAYFENIICIHHSNLNDYDLDSFQLIISNIDIPFISVDHILIHDFPSKKNITLIKNVLLNNLEMT